MKIEEFQSQHQGKLAQGRDYRGRSAHMTRPPTEATVYSFAQDGIAPFVPPSVLSALYSIERKPMGNVGQQLSIEPYSRVEFVAFIAHWTAPDRRWPTPKRERSEPVPQQAFPGQGQMKPEQLEIAQLIRPRLPARRGGYRFETPRAPIPIRAQQGLAKDQEPGGARDAAVPGGAMSEGPDQIIRALRYCEYRAADAEHAEERDQFLLVAQELRKRAAEETTRLALEIPKRPPAPSIRRDAAARRRA